MPRRSCCLAFLLTFGILPAGVIAQPSLEPQVEDWTRTYLERWFRGQGTTWRQVEAMADRLFRSIDRDGNGITPADYEFNQGSEEAAQRASALRDLLKYDLDNDGVVRRDELVAFFSRGIPESRRVPEQVQSDNIRIPLVPEQRAAILKTFLDNALRDDRNGDGALDFEEMRLAAAKSIRRLPKSVDGWSSDASGLQKVPTAFDRNGDGTITWDEFAAVIRAAFREADTDGDDMITTEEWRVFEEKARASRRILDEIAEQRKQAAENAARAASCAFPPVPEQAKLVLLGSGEGRALSTASIGDDESTVTAARIVIEPGTDPIYLVLVSESANIWLVSGAVDRIAQVVATSRESESDRIPRVGVVGIDREKVYLPPRADCLPAFSGHPTVESLKAATSLADYLNRKPDTVLGAEGVATLGVPSGVPDETTPFPGKVAIPTSGPSFTLWRAMLENNPAGLVSIDPGTIVSHLPVKPYHILPNYAGLARLVEDGSIKIVSSKTYTIQYDTKVDIKTVPYEFLVLRKIRYPGGLEDPYAFSFVLARGVPEPEGNPGRSTCIVSEETGKGLGEPHREC